MHHWHQFATILQFIHPYNEKDVALHWKCLGRSFFWLWDHRCDSHILLIQPIHCSHCSSPPVAVTCTEHDASNRNNYWQWEPRPAQTNAQMTFFNSNYSKQPDVGALFTLQIFHGAALKRKPSDHICTYCQSSNDSRWLKCKETASCSPSARALTFLQCWEGLQWQRIDPAQSLPAVSSKKLFVLPSFGYFLLRLVIVIQYALSCGSN